MDAPDRLVGRRQKYKPITFRVKVLKLRGIDTGAEYFIRKEELIDGLGESTRQARRFVDRNSKYELLCSGV